MQVPLVVVACRVSAKRGIANKPLRSTGRLESASLLPMTKSMHDLSHLHLFVLALVVVVGEWIELGKVSDGDLVRPDETGPLRSGLEVALALDAVQASEQDKSQRSCMARRRLKPPRLQPDGRRRKKTHAPSFLPTGSSHSTPTHTLPSLAPNSVGPTNRTVPLRDSSSDSAT